MDGNYCLTTVKVLFLEGGGHNGTIIYLPLFCLVVCINIYSGILSDVFEVFLQVCGQFRRGVLPVVVIC